MSFGRFKCIGDINKKGKGAEGGGRGRKADTFRSDRDKNINTVQPTGFECMLNFMVKGNPDACSVSPTFSHQNTRDCLL